MVSAGGLFCFMPLRGAGAGECARRRSNFLLLRQKKVTKEKATPLSASPALRYGATCGARGQGALRNSLRACGAPLKQPQRVSSRSACVLRHTRHPARCAPRRIQRGWGTDIHTGHRFARPRFTGASASRCADWVERSEDPCGCSAVLGCPPPVAAPAAGRLRGGMGVEAPMLRHLTRRGCPSGAAQQQSEFHGAPRKRTDAGLPRSEAKGSQTGGRLLLPSFLGDARKEGAPPGAHPGTRPGHRHAAKSTSKPWLRQAQPERIRCELLPCPGFDRLSPNGRGWAASRLRQAQPKWLGITPFAINSIAASAYLISARGIKHIKTQRPVP